MPTNPRKRPYDTFSAYNNPASPVGRNSNPPRLEPVRDPLWTKIKSLSPSEKDFILYDACKRHPQILAELDNSVGKNALVGVNIQSGSQIVEFDRYSRECWYVLTNRYTTKSTSKIKLSTENVQREVLKAQREILAGSAPTMRYETRRNALEVFRKICKSVVLCDKDRSVRDREVDGSFLLDELVGSMVTLAHAMSMNERERFQEEGFYEKLVELKDLALGSDMEDLPIVFSLFEQGKVENDVETTQVTAQTPATQQNHRLNERSTEKKAQQGKDNGSTNKHIVIDLDDEVEVVDSW